VGTLQGDFNVDEVEANDPFSEEQLNDLTRKLIKGTITSAQCHLPHDPYKKGKLPLILHIDSVEGWSRQISWKFAYEIVPPNDWPHYAFVVLTRVLNSLCNTQRFRVVLSGTDYIVGDLLLCASDVRCSCHSIPRTHFTRS